MGKLSKELAELKPYEVDRAYGYVENMKATMDSASMRPAFNSAWEAERHLKMSEILRVIGELLIFVRSEFWKDQAFKMPFWLNIPKWVGIIIFLIRKVKEIVKIVNR